MAKKSSTKNKSTLKGTNSADTLTVKHSQITVTAGKGNDGIYVNKGSAHRIYGEAGNDIITVKSTGTGMRVYGDDAKSKLTGNDTFNIYGGKSNYYYGGKGSDVFNVRGGTNSSIYGGAGNDVIKVYAGSVKSVDAGTGTNKITVSGGTVSKIVGGTGNDIINVQKQKKISINAGNGSNNITIAGIDNSMFSKVSRAVIKTGSGADLITVNKGGFHAIYSSSGNDTININAGTSYISAGTGNDKVTINSKYSCVVNGNNGNDTITLKGNSYNNAICGDDGNDTIIVKNNNKTDYFNILEGGAGSDTYHIYNPYLYLGIFNGSESAKDRDVINFHCNSSDIRVLDYFPSNDTLLVNRSIFIVGISSIDKIKVTTGSAIYEFSSNEVISAANYNYNSLDVSGWVLDYLSNFAKVVSNKGVTNEIARRMGYKGN